MDHPDYTADLHLPTFNSRIGEKLQDKFGLVSATGPNCCVNADYRFVSLKWGFEGVIKNYIAFSGNYNCGIGSRILEAILENCREIRLILRVNACQWEIYIKIGLI